MSSHNSSMPNQRQRGMTLLEILIAMTIGLFLVGGILAVYVTTNQSYRVSESTSRLQESARFAFETLANDIRTSGHMGCFKGTPTVLASGFSVNPSPNPVLASGFSATIPLTGSEASRSNWVPSTDYVVSTDTITLRKASGAEAVRLTRDMAPPAGTDASDPIMIGSNPYNWGTPRLLIISDCNSADYFLTSDIPSGTPVTIPHTAARNSSASLSKTYGPDAQVMAYEQSTYFIRTNPSGQPALYRQPWSNNGVGDSEEVVEGVENMQILYGVDTNGDTTVDAYQDATAVGANWANVLSVRISLIMRTTEDGIASAAQTYTFNGATVTNRRIRRVFTTTIGLRNRLP